MKARILVIEDDPTIRDALRRFLSARELEVEEAAGCASAEKAFSASRPDLVLLDYMLPDGDAGALIPRLRAIDAGVPIVVLTAHGSIELAVAAVKAGAEQFLTKPVDFGALGVILERILESQRNRRNVAAGARATPEAPDPFVGISAASRRLRDEARRVAGSESPVLIQGETGAGKGVLAAWLHSNSPRANEPFVDVNCAGLAKEFLESELFGHEKGAFTGAASAKQGLFDVAHRGTLFLDEIGDIDMTVQPKVLKVLEDRRFRRMGDVKTRTADVRLIAATHQDLEALIAERRFREDLYFRISILPLYVTPLRERLEDVPLLAADLLRRLSRALSHGEITLTRDAERRLMEYPWPGNVRELRNVLERTVILSGKPTLDGNDLVFGRRSPTVAASLEKLDLKSNEKDHIERTLRATGGDVSAAAEKLGVSRSTLYYKLKKLGIRVSEV